MLLIKRAEAEDFEPGKWCLPNETVKENESSEDAVVRGVKEEIGMDFTISVLLLEHTYQGHITFVFTGTATGEIILNPEEVSEYSWFTYEEAISLDFAYDYNKVIQKIYDSKLIA